MLSGPPTMNGSVIREPDRSQALGRPLADDYILYFASAADTIPQWGTMPMQRDQELRKFWIQEPYLCSAVFSTVARYASYEWNLHGPAKQVRRYQDMLQMSDQGRGWQSLIKKFLQDEFTQDNGAFMEVVRLEDSPSSPCVQLNHLDSSRCFRTGLSNEPVIYFDNHNNGHVLKWYQVLEGTEFPSSVERHRGMQYCTVSRILRASQIMRDINQYMYEKVGGRRQRAIHIVGGIQRKLIADALAQANANADAEGATHYMDPVIIAALDPTARVTKETIELTSLPDSFNQEIQFKWYIAGLALAFGGDYQDYAPLPGGNLGTAQQSEVLDKKARGKGPSLFQAMITQRFNYHGIMPRTVRFGFGDQYADESEPNARAAKLRAEERAARIASGEITVQMAQALAVEAGDLPADYLTEFAVPSVHTDVEGDIDYPISEKSRNTKYTIFMRDPEGRIVGKKELLPPPAPTVLHVATEQPTERTTRYIRDADGRITGVVNAD